MVRGKIGGFNISKFIRKNWRVVWDVILDLFGWNFDIDLCRYKKNMCVTSEN